MRKVLVIDDEESIRELIRFNLEMAGFSVELAADGQEGLDKLDDSIDLVILDLMLPVLDGLTVCKITWGELELNTASHEVRKRGQLIDLTPKEFDLLKLFLLNKGKVLTRELLLEKIWGYEYDGDTRTVDVHIRRLRQKIGEEYITTVRGVDYKIVEME